MQFLADVELICEDCKGTRYKSGVLEVLYKGKNVYQVLQMTVREALLFFANVPKDIPLVWRLADMAPLTGGCHYDQGCGRFAARCGACPELGSTDENDLSRQVWQRKDRALGALKELAGQLNP